jgi:ectoine hydroxylase-related dioxygenase (phytanoyl-CoA dioxygenase family)
MSLKFGNQQSEPSGFSRFVRDGFQVFDAIIPYEQCDSLANELSEQFLNRRESAKKKIGGVRNLLRIPSVAAIAASTSLNSILGKLVAEKLFPVRAILFDKTTESNWSVSWHQDLAIAVAESIETPGFTGWSVKEGVPHVNPPRDILENMVAVRLHLDDCDANNGALKVVPGSHRFGKLEVAQIDELAERETAVVCEVPKGGALLMRPLLLHSSLPAKNPSHRRVLHVEFASGNLPNGLKWFERQ